MKKVFGAVVLFAVCMLAPMGAAAQEVTECPEGEGECATHEHCNIDEQVARLTEICGLDEAQQAKVRKIMEEEKGGESYEKIAKKRAKRIAKRYELSEEQEAKLAAEIEKELSAKGGEAGGKPEGKAGFDRRRGHRGHHCCW